MAPLDFFRLVPTRRTSRRDSSSSLSSTITANGSQKGATTSTASTDVVSSSPTIKNTRRVHFASSVSVRISAARSQYTLDEMKSCFYSSQELTVIKAERKITLRQVEKWNPTINNDRHYFRGIENLTKEGTKSKQTNMLNAKKAVLGEQENLRDRGVSMVDHPERIANVYRGITQVCVQPALERGEYDERQAFAVHGVAITTKHHQASTTIIRPSVE